jgi:hypothetical protein
MDRSIMGVLKKKWRLPTNLKNFIKFQNFKTNYKKQFKVQNVKKIPIFQKFQKTSKLKNYKKKWKFS